MAKLTMRKSECLNDWYVIERAEHDGAEWLEPIEGGYAFQCSSRISNADVEGSAREMLAIAKVIRERGEIAFGRCAVRVDREDVFFWSPRNSRTLGHASLAEADELAAIISSQLEPPTTHAQ